MNLYELIFWISTFIVIYTFIGYPFLMFIVLKTHFLRYLIKMPENSGKIFLNPKIAGPIVLNQKLPEKNYYPQVSMIIAAYNEEKFIEQKIKNCLKLNYPNEKIEFLFVTDGSTDQTPNLVRKYSEMYPSIKLYHQSEREGKLKAIQRIIDKVNGEILIFSDANALYNKDAIKFLVQPFQFENVGCVAGEKRVISTEGSVEAESIYWKYESFLKKIDSELYSIVGAAGEIYAIKKDLFEKIPDNTINEDFVLTVSIASKGFRVVYEPNAYSIEYPSKSIFEEFKRRIRISTGGIQAIFLLKKLFNIRKYKFLSFQFISHRILRWTLTPLSLLLLFITNLVVLNESKILFYELTFYCQLIFYTFALFGLIGELIGKRKMIFYLIFSFHLMNFAAVLALLTYPFKPRTNIWTKVER